MTESELKNQIADWLETQHILFTFHVRGKMKYTSRYMRAGWPDITGILPAGHRRGSGRGLLIEVKLPGGTISEAQHNIVQTARDAGAVAFFAFCLEAVVLELG